MNKGQVMLDVMLPSNQHATVIAQPRDRSLHDPPMFVPSQLAAVVVPPSAVVASIRTNQLRSTLAHPLPQRIRIISTIRHQPLRLAGNLVQRRFQQGYFRRGGRLRSDRQRNSLAVCHHHKLRTLSAFGFSDAIAPFFAGENVPSAKHSSQSSQPRWSRLSSNACQAFSHTPASSHSMSRRRQVLYEGYSSGKSFHRAPLRRTQRIPSKHGRLGTGVGPPLRLLHGSGNKGDICCHCSSVSSVLAIATPFAAVNKSQNESWRKLMNY
jgi:hypothetical protein